MDLLLPLSILNATAKERPSLLLCRTTTNCSGDILPNLGDYGSSGGAYKYDPTAFLYSLTHKAKCQTEEHWLLYP